MKCFLTDDRQYYKANYLQFQSSSLISQTMTMICGWLRVVLYLGVCVAVIYGELVMYLFMYL